ncbi:MAG: adenylate/guanylate cyclase domain-containing protein, partial [Chloroflexota bacterium]
QLDQVAVWDGDVFQATCKQGLQNLAAIPIVTDQAERLGALLLIRSDPFETADVALMEAAEKMIDSAVVQVQRQLELEQHVRELNAIHQIDHIRDKGLPFDDMLMEVLQAVCQATEAVNGFTMLYNNTGQTLELKATTHQDLFQVPTQAQIIRAYADEALQLGALMCYNDLPNGIQAIMCLPLILNDELIGVLGVINPQRQASFSNRDKRVLAAIGSQIDTAIFERIEQRRLRRVLGRSVDPRVMERLLDDPNVDFLAGERMTVSVLYADLRGSTQLAEETEPEQFVEFINDYLGTMTTVILNEEGTLDKFVGDEVMALFGAPFPQPDHAFRAVRTALAMQHQHQTIMTTWQQRGFTPAPIGIGIATGELIVGEMGGPQRTDFTVIGRAANLGARICGAAKPGEVLICPNTFALASEKLKASPISGLQFKGVERDVMVYRVESILA